MAKLNTLRNQSLQDIATVMLRVKHDLCPEHIQGLFQENNSSCNLTNSDFIISIYNTVKYGNRSLRFAGPLLWSKLTKCIKNAISLSASKTRLEQVIYKLSWDMIIMGWSEEFVSIFFIFYVFILGWEKGQRIEYFCVLSVGAVSSSLLAMYIANLTIFLYSMCCNFIEFVILHFLIREDLKV